MTSSGFGKEQEGNVLFRQASKKYQPVPMNAEYHL